MGISEMSFDEHSNAGPDDLRQPANQAGSDAEAITDAAPSWTAALGTRSVEEQVAPI